MTDRYSQENYLKLKQENVNLEEKHKQFARTMHIVTIATALVCLGLGEYVGKQKCLEQKQNSNNITTNVQSLSAQDSATTYHLQIDRPKYN